MTVVATAPQRHRTQPAAVHAYTVPVVRELPPRPLAVLDDRTW